MEAVTAVEMYQRSVQRYNIHYNPFIGDGDSIAYSTVDPERPYGPTIFTKERRMRKSRNQAYGYIFTSAYQGI